MSTQIRIERVYDDPGGTSGGFRVYVDRLWPRGESKEKFHYDLWAKDVTPSTALREWYHADRADRLEEFREKYHQELEANSHISQLVTELKPHHDIVLLTAAKDVEHSHVPVLADYLAAKLSF